MLGLFFCRVSKLYMKNILIPTTLVPDTLGAVKTAIKHAGEKGCTLVLMMFCNAPDAFSETDYSGRTVLHSTPVQHDVLNQCRLAVKQSTSCNLNIHHQHGLTGPLLRNLLEFKKIDFVVMPESYKMAPEKIHKYCYKLLFNSKYPILMPGCISNGHHMANALYLEQYNTSLPLHEVRKMIDGKFPYRIVSRAMVSEMQNPEDLRAILAETILKNDINVLVQTRKYKKLKFTAKADATVNEMMGLPLLSLYEG